MRPFLLFLSVVLLLLLSCRSHYPVTTDNFTAVRWPESMERGRNLTFNICGGCHYDPGRRQFTGKQLKDIPKIAGKVYAANITQSARYGATAHYSDAALFYLIKTGIARDGRFMPYMMRPNIADRDLNDIIVYLRSADPAVQPADTLVGKTHLNPIGRLGLRLVAHPQPYRTGIPRPAAPAGPQQQGEAAIAYGRYLVDMTGCFHCHSKKATSINYLHPETTKGYLAGGAKMKTPDGKVRGPNLTFDGATGIGRYTQEQFRKAVQQGLTPEGVRLQPPMPRFPMTDDQADAIYAYLKSRPPVRHEVKR